MSVPNTPSPDECARRAVASVLTRLKPDEPVRADQRTEDTPRHVHEDGNPDDERIPAPGAVRRVGDRRRNEPTDAGGIGCFLGRLVGGVRSDPEPGHGDEREGEQPDEEPVCKGPSDDSAADLAVPVHDVESSVDRSVLPPLPLAQLGRTTLRVRNAQTGSLEHPVIFAFLLRFRVAARAPGARPPRSSSSRLRIPPRTTSPCPARSASTVLLLLLIAPFETISDILTDFQNSPR
jgi:hypothetical protein